MRTKDEVIKRFESLKGQTAKEIIHWYYDEMTIDQKDELQVIFDGDGSFEWVKLRMKKKNFVVNAIKNAFDNNRHCVEFLFKINEHQILRINEQTMF